MTFAQIPYIRPDFGALIEKLSGFTAGFVNAKTCDEAERIVYEVDAMLRVYRDASSLATIRYTQDTRDEFYSAEQEFFAENGPALEEKHTDFQKAMLASPFRDELEGKIGKVAFINAEIAAKTISPQVLELLAKEEMLALEYQKVMSTELVDFRGESLPVSKMGLHTASADRATRREATEAVGIAKMKNAAEYDRIFDEMVKLRTEIACKLGFDNFIQLGYLRMTRNCYGPDEVETFRRQVKKELVPLITSLKNAQAKRLGLDELSFYDDSVLRPQGNPKPIIVEDELYQAGIRMYRDMNPDTAAMVDHMDSLGAFDLSSRNGKMTGGYCDYIFGQKTPFIFANFNGTAGDVEVFTHEGGHAFQCYMNRDYKLMHEMHPTYEACEVHSMSMEFLCWPYLDRFYGDEAEAAKVIHLIGALYFIPYGCLVDEYQHSVYANPNMTPDERNRTWAKLEKEYFPNMEYDGLPFFGDGRRWQRQLHIFTNPFYYIDYCLAQTCALQIAALIQSSGWDAAWNQYMAYTLLGGKMTFTEMLEEAGFKSPFKDGALTDIITVAKKYIDEHSSEI